jgi:hypothetical protein
VEAILQDSLLARLPAGPQIADSVVPQRFAPAPIIQFIFQQPPWLMWGGVVVAVILGSFLLYRVWQRRQEIRAWYGSWSRGSKAAFFGALALLAVGAVAFSAKSYDYVMNDSRFCTGCHIFMPPGHTVSIADTGDYTLISRLSGKHDTLNCHTCHTFHAMSEARKMVFWMSGFRYTKEALNKEGAPAHGYVPRTVCEGCHVQGAAKETWQAIVGTAGHRVHLESDSASGKLLSGSECLTCHAQTAHVFRPTDTTCSQRGCHLTDKTRIRLGKMSAAGGMHCTLCHAFTTVVPALATADSASASLRPAAKQCLGCHSMQQVLPDFNAAKDPHKAQCGVCHNPHEQTTPAAALKSCASAGCHANWRENPFHTGKIHKSVAQNCLTCHQPHSARVDASDCVGCHNSVRARTKYRPPLPFDTTKALRRVSLAAPGPTDEEPRGKGDIAPEEVSSGALLSRLVTPDSGLPADSFPHSRHRKLSCIVCHSTGSGHGGLNFEQPRGCQICHHQAPATSRCATCHAADEMARPLTLPIHLTVEREPPRTRDVRFAHPKHASIQCVQCHVTPVTLDPPAPVMSCRDCHATHHEARRDCASCHTGYDIRAKHAFSGESSHQRCDACHTASTVKMLEPLRSFCATCHEPQRDAHYADRECVTCHLLREPAEWKRKLATPDGG